MRTAARHRNAKVRQLVDDFDRSHRGTRISATTFGDGSSCLFSTKGFPVSSRFSSGAGEAIGIAAGGPRALARRGGDWLIDGQQRVVLAR